MNNDTSNEDRKLIEDYRADMDRRSQEKLLESEHLISHFKDFSKNRGINLSDDDFEYYDAIGVVAKKKNLTCLLTGFSADKEGLLLIDDLKKNFEVKPHISGFLYAENFMVMPHPFFRRGFSEINNFAPRLVEMLWHLNDPKIEMSLALDPDRVRIDVSDSIYMELDTWYGAPFSESIADMPDGTSKLRPPLDIKEEDISFFFKSAYSLDTMWKTKGCIKSFQAEEFKDENVRINVGSETYYPVRYIHAEYDTNLEVFRHFDGAVHLYTEDEYLSRRDLDFDHTFKADDHIKPRSIKLFKMNGAVSVKTWVDYCSHFCSGNPLIFEYFTGKYPDRLEDTIGKLRSSNMT